MTIQQERIILDAVLDRPNDVEEHDPLVAIEYLPQLMRDTIGEGLAGVDIRHPVPYRYAIRLVRKMAIGVVEEMADAHGEISDRKSKLFFARETHRRLNLRPRNAHRFGTDEILGKIDVVDEQAVDEVTAHVLGLGKTAFFDIQKANVYRQRQGGV